MTTVELTGVQVEALWALDGMLEVTRNEMLRRGDYISRFVVSEYLEEHGAVCGGHRACAVGALWLGAGVEIEYSMGMATLPGTNDSHQREEFLETRPALALAYAAMNQVCDEYIDELDLRGRLNADFADSMEQLFESTSDEYDPETSDPLSLIDAQVEFPGLIVSAAELIISGSIEA